MKSGDSDRDYFRVIPESLNEEAGIVINKNRSDAEQYRSEDQREKESLTHALIFLSAEVESCDRLKTLADSERSAEDEHADSICDSHCGDGSVTIHTGGVVEDHCRYARKSLSCKARQARGYYVPDRCFVERRIFEFERSLRLFPNEHRKEQEP